MYALTAVRIITPQAGTY